MDKIYPPILFCEHHPCGVPTVVLQVPDGTARISKERVNVLLKEGYAVGYYHSQRHQVRIPLTYTLILSDWLNRETIDLRTCTSAGCDVMAIVNQSLLIRDPAIHPPSWHRTATRGQDLGIMRLKGVGAAQVTVALLTYTKSFRPEKPNLWLNKRPDPYRFTQQHDSLLYRLEHGAPTTFLKGNWSYTPPTEIDPVKL